MLFYIDVSVRKGQIYDTFSLIVSSIQNVEMEITLINDGGITKDILQRLELEVEK